MRNTSTPRSAVERVKARPRSYPLSGVIVFALPITAVLAGVVKFGELSPHAVTSVLVGLLGLLGILAPKRRIDPVVRAVILAFVAWSAVTVVHLAFRGIPLSNEITIAASGLTILFGVAALQGTRQTFRVFAGGWVIAYGLACGAAIAEKYFGYLPRNNYLVLQRGYRVEDVGLASFFGNPNGFALFLFATSVVFVPFVIGAVRASSRAFFLLLQLSTLVFMLETGSRTGFSLLLIVFAVTWWHALSKHPVLRVGAVLAFGSAVIVRWLLSMDTITTVTSSGLADDESAVTRLNLALNGVAFLWSSPLIGIGPGMFEEYMREGNPPFPTGAMIAPHNGFAEMFSQYGIIVFLLMVVVFVRLWKRARLDMVGAGAKRDFAYMSGVARILLIALLPLSVTMHSSFLGDPSAWMYLAAVIVFDRLVEPERISPHGERLTAAKPEVGSGMSRTRERGRYSVPSASPRAKAR